MDRFLRLCRTTHSWLGALVVPWVLIIGATGYYLNHEQFVLRSIGYTELSSADLFGLPEIPITEAMASQIAASVWPDQPIQNSGPVKYRRRKAYAFKKNSGLIIFPGSTSSRYFVQTTLREKTYAMDGTLLHTQYNLKRIFKSLHERGWMGTRLGTWLADIVAIAMVFFSISGITMWSVPKVRRIRRRLARGRAKHRPE